MVKKQTTPSTPKAAEPAKEEVKKINSIRVSALWKGFSPDCRQWKPSTPQIEFPELWVVVDVPLDPDLIKNASVISMAQISNQGEPKPHFTPLGMRYIIDQFESAMKNGEPEPEVPPKYINDEWDEGADKLKIEQRELNKSILDDDEWIDEDTTTKSKEDAPWNEDWDEINGNK